MIGGTRALVVAVAFVSLACTDSDDRAAAPPTTTGEGGCDASVEALDFYDEWTAHQYVLRLSEDGAGESTFRTADASGEGIVEQSVTYSTELSDDTLVATVTSVGRTLQSDNAPPSTVGLPTDYGPTVGDMLALSFCLSDVLQVRAVQVTHPTEPGFTFVCRTGAPPGYCGA